VTVEAFLTKRFAALQAGDFATVYATYHQDSPFIQQFADCGTYVRFAEDNLSAIKVENWQALQQRELEPGQEEHLLVMQLSVAGQSQYFYELALLIETSAGWRYHSAQKLSSEDYPGPPQLIQFAHFDHVKEKIRY
jgi:SEC-C motif-containing protein